MRENGNWCLSLGRWSGVSVRIHMFFLLFAAFTLYLAWQSNLNEPDGRIVQASALSLGILVLSVLAHEFGHILAARRLGGRVDEIVLGPLGGMGTIKVPYDPRSEVIVHLAGPLANLTVFLFCGLAIMASQDESLLGLMYPLHPIGLTLDAPWWVISLKLTCWINWALVLVNLIPAFPFDGGRALRAGLSQLWRHDGRILAGVVVSRLAQFAAVALLVVAWMLRNSQQSGPVPAWFALVLLAIFLFFSARQPQDPQVGQSDDEDLLGYDFSRDDSRLADERDLIRDCGPLAQWFEQRRQAKSLLDQEVEQEDERCIDKILARLHDEGIESLSREDRALLDRVSARYRDRLGPRA